MAENYDPFEPQNKQADVRLTDIVDSRYIPAQTGRENQLRVENNMIKEIQMGQYPSVSGYAVEDRYDRGAADKATHRIPNGIEELFKMQGTLSELISDLRSRLTSVLLPEPVQLDNQIPSSSEASPATSEMAYLISLRIVDTAEQCQMIRDIIDRLEV